MSAFVVSKQHIQFLVEASTHAGMSSYDRVIRWYHGGADGRLHELTNYDEDRKSEVGAMLWAENVESVRYRYPDCTDELPGPIDCDFEYGDHVDTLNGRNLDPVAVLKAIDGLEYQSCEHPGWRESEAFAFLEALRVRACRALPGYEDAAWCIG